MQFILDNLVATVIGAVIFFMAIFVNQSGREAMNDSTAFYVMIRQQEEFAQILTRDMQGVESLITAKEVSDRFTFRGHIGDDPTLYTIAYEREQVREKDGVTLYRVKRLVNGELDGGSADIITGWKIEGQDEFGQEVNDPDAVDQIVIRFEVASYMGGQARMKNSYWEASFFPPLLQRVEAVVIEEEE